MMIKTAAFASLAAAALALAPTAHADDLQVIFQPNLGGMNVRVSDTSGYPQAQNCTYTSVSAGGIGSLVPPQVAKPFSIPPGATVDVRLPGIPTGTTWQVLINCEWAGPPLPTTGGNPTGPRPQPGRFNGIQTY
jgi:hypothetical protein